MPYNVVKTDGADEWCVFKSDADKQPIGETLGCHPSKSKAQDQIAAILISEGEASGRIVRRAVALIDEVEGIIQGYIAIWGKADLTDAYDTWFDRSRPPEMELDLLPIALRYEHGGDPSIAGDMIGTIYEFGFDDEGIFFLAKLDRSSPYIFSRMVTELRDGITTGERLCTSSGTANYVARFRDDGSFEFWPVNEVSLTAFPAEKRMPPAILVRSEQGVDPGTEATTEVTEQEALPENTSPENVIAQPQGEKPMQEQIAEILATLPEGAELPEFFAALVAAGFEVADLEEAVAMLGEPVEEEERSETEGQPLDEKSTFADALAKVLDAKAIEENAEEARNLRAQNAKLRGQAALHQLQAQRSAPPVDQPQQGDMTDGGNGNQSIAVSSRYAHLSGKQMAFIYMAEVPEDVRLKGLDTARYINPDFVKHMAYTLQRKVEAHERGDRQYPNELDFNAIRSLIPRRADELMAVATTGQGLEWVGVEYGSAVWNTIRQQPIFDKLIAGGMMQVEVPQGAASEYVLMEGADPIWNYAAEAVSVDTSGDGEHVSDAQYMGTDRQLVTPAKFQSRVLITDELQEDSRVNVLAQLQTQQELKAALVLEDVFINGDTETAANTNINYIDSTPPTGTSRVASLGSNGALKLALVTNTANKRDGAALSDQDYLATRRLFTNALAADPSQMLFIVDTATMLKSLELVALKTQDVFSMATLENGVLTGVWGTEVLTSGQMALANSAGKIPTAAGTLGRILAVIPLYWAIGWKRRVTMENLRTRPGVTEVVSTMRAGFQYRTNEASAVSYNLTITAGS